MAKLKLIDIEEQIVQWLNTAVEELEPERAKTLMEIIAFHCESRLAHLNGVKPKVVHMVDRRKEEGDGCVFCDIGLKPHDDGMHRANGHEVPCKLAVIIKVPVGSTGRPSLTGARGDEGQ